MSLLLLPFLVRLLSYTMLDRYLGVTPPISVNESNEREKLVTVSLMEELKRQGIFESEEESKTR